MFRVSCDVFSREIEISIGNYIEEEAVCDLCRGDGRRSTRGTNATLTIREREGGGESATTRLDTGALPRCALSTIRVGCRLVASYRSFDDFNKREGEGRHTRAIATDVNANALNIDRTRLDERTGRPGDRASERTNRAIEQSSRRSIAFPSALLVRRHLGPATPFGSLPFLPFSSTLDSRRESRRGQ